MLVSKLSSILLTAAGLAAAQTSDDISAAIGKINQARQTRGLQPLAWNGDLAAYAAFWANQMATGAVPFGHASGPYRPDQGETLFERQSTQCDLAYDTPLLTAANAWLAEGSNWNGQPISSGHESWLHWSQCMWTNTAYIGCARAFSTSQPHSFFSVCRFYPEGNIIGQMPF